MSQVMAYGAAWMLGDRRRGVEVLASPAERGFIEAVAQAERYLGEDGAVEAAEAIARIQAMENGSYLPTNEHPYRFLVRLARDTGDEGILAEATEELEGLASGPSLKVA